MSFAPCKSKLINCSYISRPNKEIKTSLSLAIYCLASSEGDFHPHDIAIFSQSANQYYCVLILFLSVFNQFFCFQVNSKILFSVLEKVIFRFSEPNSTAFRVSLSISYWVFGFKNAHFSVFGFKKGRISVFKKHAPPTIKI